MKIEVEILLQTNMNSINNGWDNTKWAEMPYFHCGPSGQNENKVKGKKTREKNPKQQQHENE